MNIEIKEIIDEFIAYRTTRKPIKHLTNIYNKYENIEFIQLIHWLLFWHKEVFLDLAKPELFEIDDVWFRQYTMFFKEVPAIKKVFTLNKDNITWNKSITVEEQEEIRNYIHKNYKVLVRIRRYKK